MKRHGLRSSMASSTKRALLASSPMQSHAQDSSASMLRHLVPVAQNESGTVPKHDPAILLLSTRGGDDCASADACGFRHDPLRRASYECVMSITRIRLWSMVVCRSVAPVR